MEVTIHLRDEKRQARFLGLIKLFSVVPIRIVSPDYWPLFSVAPSYLVPSFLHCEGTCPTTRDWESHMTELIVLGSVTTNIKPLCNP